MAEGQVFPLDQALLDDARAILPNREQIYWIIGGSCTGKSTVAREIARSMHVTLYDMDAHFFGHTIDRFNMERHPASKTWFSAENPLAWSLSLSWEAFDAMYRAANAECLNLFAEDLANSGTTQPLLVDGGITHPSVLVQLVPPRNVVCLQMEEKERVRIWETAAERAEMKRWIRQLPEPDRMWRKFLYFDKMITQTIGRESREHGIPQLDRVNKSSVQAFASKVAGQLGLNPGLSG
jgi:hypothetical protein